MKTSSAELFKRALDLSERERATLAGLLIESLEEQPAEDLESVWKAEVERRIEDLESGDVHAIPWGDVKARLLREG